MARKYVWWQSPERTLRDRRLLLAQMMTLGTADDARWLVSRVPAARACAIPPWACSTAARGSSGAAAWASTRRRLSPPPPAVPVPAMTFLPRLDVLPDRQRALWPALADVPDSCVLYDGTALALRLGHRSSVDFDFFSSEAVDLDGLFELPLLAGAEVLQRAPDTLTVSATVSTTPSATEPVRISFFAGIDIGRVGNPERTADGVLQVASLLDLFATKLKVLLERVAAKDYLDLAAILRSGVPLEEGLGAAAALYENRFPPMDAVKALAYFDEGDAANVDAATRRYLSDQVEGWDFAVTRMGRVAGTLTGVRVRRWSAAYRPPRRCPAARHRSTAPPSAAGALPGSGRGRRRYSGSDAPSGTAAGI